MANAIERFAFTGNAGSFSFAEITGNEWDNALRKVGWREAHNAHLLKRLKERGTSFGLKTLDDFAAALRSGTTTPADGGASGAGVPKWTLSSDFPRNGIHHGDGPAMI